jgi:hypothetical protein
VKNGIEWHAPVFPSDFLPLSRVRLLEGCQSGWDGSDMGRCANSIWPVVSFMPWFRRFDDNRFIISIIKRMMANHSCLRIHLGRIGIVESPMCICSRDYETVNHVLWGCERFDAEKQQLWIDLGLTDTKWGAPNRDILGGSDWRSLRACCSFFRRSNLYLYCKDINNRHHFARGPSVWSSFEKKSI